MSLEVASVVPPDGRSPPGRSTAAAGLAMLTAVAGTLSPPAVGGLAAQPAPGPPAEDAASAAPGGDGAPGEDVSPADAPFGTRRGAPPAARPRPGEHGATWFPARTSFPPLLAAPREVSLRGGFLLADREGRTGDFRGANLEADVALGHRFPVVRLQQAGTGRPELTLGFEVGVFTRFFMETPQKDLISADFRVGAPLSARLGGWRARLAPRHASAHLGDDFVGRFGASNRQVTKDGFELLVARDVAEGARLYGGGEWNFHVNEGVERAAARAGAEWDPGSAGVAPAAGAGTARRREDRRRGDRGELRAWPFLATDLRVTTLTEEVAGTATGGLALEVEGVVLRLEARAHVGPTPLGELRTRDEAAGGLGLRVEP